MRAIGYLHNHNNNENLRDKIYQDIVSHLGLMAFLETTARFSKNKTEIKLKRELTIKFYANMILKSAIEDAPPDIDKEQLKFGKRKLKKIIDEVINNLIKMCDIDLEPPKRRK